VTTKEQWVGDLGHLALVDAALGARLLDILHVPGGHARYPQAPENVEAGKPTGWAVKQVQARLHSHPYLFPETAAD
jgi:hypothetical protein